MKIQDFLEKYHDGVVHISTNVTESQREIIEKNHQMKSGKFEDPYFEDGETEKHYFNVVLGFWQTLIRGSKLRLNELGVTSLNGKWFKMIEILRGGLRHFLKYNGFAQKRDEILEELTGMGHVVTKVVDGDTTVVDLRNLVFKPDAVSLKEEGCAEKIYYSYEDAKALYGENEHWKEIEEHYKKIKDSDDPRLTFIEYWTEDEFDGEVAKGCIVYLDRSEGKPEEYDRPDEWTPQLELDRFTSEHWVKCRNKREVKLYGKKRRVFPYDEERLLRIKGRYLGMGAFEMCRPAQEQYNEDRNMKRKFDRLALRGILVHKIGTMRSQDDAEALSQEFLKRLDTGAAAKIYSDESLERLNVGSMTNEVTAMTNDLFEFMRFLLGITPLAVGDEGANKTAYFAMTQNQAQQTTYQYVKTKTAALFERLFQDFLMDDIVEEAFNKDVLTITGEKGDLEELDRYLAEQTVYSNPDITSEEEADAEIDRLVQEQQQYGGNRFIDMSDRKIRKMMKKLLNEIDWLIEFTFSENAIDPNAKIKTLLEVDKIQNQKLKAVVLDVIGVSPKLLEETEAEKRKALQEEAMRANTMAQAENIQPAPQPLTA